MIIGNGDIASVLPDRDDLLFFASGVSNSQETNGAAYDREANLLREQDYYKHIVYFSSLATLYANTYYARHKRKMEEFVKEHFNDYTIVRIGNITWGNNPNTFINYYNNCVKERRPFAIKDEYRYIIDKEEFLHWINLIPKWSCEMNIPGKRMKVADIIKQYGKS